MWIARVAEAAYAEDVNIDGILDDACWMNYEDKFYAPEGGSSVADSTRFAFAYDENDLYLAAMCYESNMDSIIALLEDRDAMLFGEDCVGYFLQPDPSRQVAYQIYFNAIGTCFDAHIVVDTGGWPKSDVDWNGDYDVMIHRGDGFWSFEARLGLEQFGVRAEKGGTMNINFRRKQKRLNTAADWMAIDHHPDSYGLLRLE
jgi:hypothetical protein